MRSTRSHRPGARAGNNARRGLKRTHIDTTPEIERLDVKPCPSQRRLSALSQQRQSAENASAAHHADLPYRQCAIDNLDLVELGGGDFWISIAQDLRDASPRGYPKLLATYPDGAGGVDLQSFFDLITIHELGHAFEVLGDLRLPTFWLSEIFVNLALHAFVATRLPASLPTLEVLSTVGAGRRKLAARMRAEGYSTLEELQTHYTGSDDSMSPLNYVWFQYRWQRLAARIFEADGEDGLVRFSDCFHSRNRANDGATAASLAPLLTAEVSPILGRAVRNWR